MNIVNIINEELLKYKIKGEYSGTKTFDVYKNPPSIKNMSPRIRAVSSPEGDLYVVDDETIRKNILHMDIFAYLRNIMGLYVTPDFVGWERKGTTNEFYLSSGVDNEILKNDEEFYREHTDKLNNMHPNIKFIDIPYSVAVKDVDSKQSPRSKIY